MGDDFSIPLSSITGIVRLHEGGFKIKISCHKFFGSSGDTYRSLTLNCIDVNEERSLYKQICECYENNTSIKLNVNL